MKAREEHTMEVETEQSHTGDRDKEDHQEDSREVDQDHCLFRREMKDLVEDQRENKYS